MLTAITGINWGDEEKSRRILASFSTVLVELV